MQILKAHISAETAYIIPDYPYGFKLRCQMRCWLEYKPNQGVRFVTQTSNPKRPGLVWNKPKASTYSRFGGCMYLDEKGHVEWSGLSEYTDTDKAIAWREQYGTGVPEACKELLDKYIAAKKVYDARKAQTVTNHE